MNNGKPEESRIPEFEDISPAQFWQEAINLMPEKYRKLAQKTYEKLDSEDARDTIGEWLVLMHAHAAWVNRRLQESDLHAEEIAIAAAKRLPKEALDTLAAVKAGKLSEQMERATENAGKSAKQIFTYCRIAEDALRKNKELLENALADASRLWRWCLLLAGLVIGMLPSAVETLVVAIQHFRQ
ncbi:hypothetical protein [Verrucomicrobium sp. 3C]|uniref:hypothetical protein n=1 Tax=Verrucomicrobium sp. 3C TaxID=1134055 RepID=UPI000377B071|nr:hypothetical protein [Verrucomicrobium sp. 3C]